MKTQSKDLSKREKDVVELLLQGKSNKQMAMTLEIAETTVEFHLRNIYAKLQVGSRAEAILKLGKSASLITENSGETFLEGEGELQHTSSKLFSEENESVKNVSSIRTDLEMKNRLFTYFLAGLIFGTLFWFYFDGIGRFINRFSNFNEESALAIWAVLSIEFLFVFGVWLIPTLFPARYEFRHSKRVGLSVIAVIVMWISAVLGYYLIYTVLLAFIGLPHMQYYLIFGQHGPTFWQDWAELFTRLIFFKFLQWSVIGVIVSGIAGFVTSSLYSFWMRKTTTISPHSA